MWCVRNSHKDLRPVWNISCLWHPGKSAWNYRTWTLSAVERIKWKLHTYEPDISLLQLLDLKRKHKAALHIWNIDLIRWPWFSFWKQEGRSPNINPWCGQAVTYPGVFFFACHSCYFSGHIGEVDEKIWNTETDNGGTVHETALLPHFAIHMYGLCIQNCC